MNKTIWTCWFQGRDTAPPVVQACFNSWERQNPGWRFRCLDASSLERYVPLTRHLDLQRQRVTAASLSDVLRILLLHEFGGVWVDATLFCHKPLDEWLPCLMAQGFFAFAKPASDRPLSSWFLAAEPGTHLIASWCRLTLEYWADRTQSDDYFWFHHLFRHLCDTDPAAAASWARVPRVSADGPHALQFDGRMHRKRRAVEHAIDWTAPVFKLTHRLPDGRAKPGSVLDDLLARDGADARRPEREDAAPRADTPKTFAALKVSTENLGDHIQILAGLRLLSPLGIEPARFIDRDDEIRSAPGLEAEDGPVGILLNGWFKTNRREWPPHSKLAPLMYGFHIRLFQCPELVSSPSIEFFRRHQPIGCRDAYTEALLRSHGVAAFTSHCLSLTFPRRIEDRSTQTKVFVVSRDSRINAYLPASVGPYTFISHYTGTNDFAANMRRAMELLDRYRSEARLVVTTLLHCALPAIAMGIPTVVFYPINGAAAHASDLERFSALDGLVPVYDLDEIARVDWNPPPVDVSQLKLQILEGFYERAVCWNRNVPRIGPIAPAGLLPPP